MDRHRRSVMGVVLGSVAALVLAATPLAAQTFTSGSTGADGVFSPSSNTVLTVPPGGVFNFTTITIPGGVTVTFTKNAANTPVYLLATGNVTLNGVLIVNGGAGAALGRPGLGGPGGFDGGPGADGVTLTVAGTGLGPGGGLLGTSCVGSGGSYATPGTVGTYNCTTPGPAAPTYGSPALRPIVGGSGGSGGSAWAAPGIAGGSGGGGGGALVLASSGTLTIGSGGQIVADGGAGGPSDALPGGGGSGGAIRVIATTLNTSGSLYARGGAKGTGLSTPGVGGKGRIRLEAYTLTVSGTRDPEATQSLPLSVFPSAGQPALTLASVAGVAAPASPSGSFLTIPDILLPTGTTSPVQVALAAANVPLGTTIQVTASPQSGAKTTATSTGLAGTVESSTATASLTISLTQTSVVTASATFPMVAAAGEGPLYAAGEEVTHVRVAAVLGGPSSVTYLTRSGREIAVQ